MAEPQRTGDTAALTEVRGRIEQRAAAAAHDPRLAVAEADADALLVRLEQARDRRWRRLIPRKFWTATCADLDGHAATAAAAWIGGGMAANVLLLGPVGVGKSHAAAALARAAYDAGHSIRFVTVVDLLDELRPGGRHRIAPDRVDVLVLDEVGVEKPTDWAAQEIDKLINRRWSAGLPTIATSNLAADVLAEQVGPRAWSRLYDGSIRRVLAGPDRRRT